MSAEKPVERSQTPEKPKKVSPGRRKFLSGMAGAAGSGCLMALGVGIYSRQASALPPLALRPPGALPEPEFLAACTRCGICVRDCPPSVFQDLNGKPLDILKLAAPGDPVPTGTPYFTARSAPCIMCEDIPCVVNCPTGALDAELKDINKARMGLAVLVDQETCVAFLGLRCEICYNACPVFGKAITLEKRRNPRSDRHAMLLPIVHSEYCTGCGLCEKSCILEESAIRVIPPALAQGKLGSHYREGWAEKQKHGGSLIGDQLELPIRGLEDRAFGDTRLNGDASRDAPRSADPPPFNPGSFQGIDLEGKP
jgi:ferredoxin-type protein NapG